MTAQTDTYNGWTNYETWGCSLILDNDEGTYREVRERAAEILREVQDDTNVVAYIWTEEEAATSRLEDWLKDYTEELCGLEDDSLTMMARQLLGGAIGSVNFREIAESILAE